MQPNNNLHVSRSSFDDYLIECLKRANETEWGVVVAYNGNLPRAIKELSDKCPDHAHLFQVQVIQNKDFAGEWNVFKKRPNGAA